MIKYIVMAAMIVAPYVIPSSLPPLSEEESGFYKDQAVELLQKYYQQINLITGDSSMSFDQKGEIENNLLTDYFSSPSIVVFNDIPDTDAVQDMRIKEYLDELNDLYGDPKSGITFMKPKIEVYGIYDDEDSFFMDVSVERTMRCYGKPAFSNVKKLDYYIGFAPYSRNIRIYSITEHGENQSGFTKAVVATKTGHEKPAAIPPPSPSGAIADESGSGSVIFNVTPSDAEVKVDGQSLYYVNGVQVTLAKGNHTIEIVAPHYYRYIYTNYSVEAGAVNTITKDLMQKEGTLKLLSVNGSANGGYVYIDGDSAGRMPLNYIPLSEGLHSIQIFKDGYFAWKKNIKIEAAQDAELQVQLVNIQNTDDALRIISNVLYPRIEYISSPISPYYALRAGFAPVNSNLHPNGQSSQINHANNTNKSSAPPANAKATNAVRSQSLNQKPEQRDDKVYTAPNTNNNNKPTSRQNKGQIAKQKSDEGWMPVEPDFSGKKRSPQTSQQQSRPNNRQSAASNSAQKKGKIKTVGNPYSKPKTQAPIPQRGYSPQRHR